MAKIALGIGSNINREENIRSGIDELAKFIHDLSISPVYESPAFGFDGHPFLNLVVTGTTDQSLDAMIHVLRQVEYRHGREVNASKFSSRQLDIDILLFDQQVGSFSGVTLPREEILQQAYVLKPLADVAGQERHPISGKTFAQLWLDFSGDKRQVWQSEFQLQVAKAVGFQ